MRDEPRHLLLTLSVLVAEPFDEVDLLPMRRLDVEPDDLRCEQQRKNGRPVDKLPENDE